MAFDHVLGLDVRPIEITHAARPPPGGPSSQPHVPTQATFPQEVHVLRRIQQLSLGVAALAVIVLSFTGSARAWTQSQFAIGTHWDPKIVLRDSANASFYDSNNMGSVNSAAVKLAKDAYFNLMFGVGDFKNLGSPYPDCRIVPIRAEVDSILNYVAQAGLKMMPGEWGFFTRQYAGTEHSFCPECVPATTPSPLVNMLQHYEGLSTASSVYGYYYWDEPSIDFGTMVGLVRDHADGYTSKPIFVNLLPRYSPSFGSNANYEAYLDTFLTRSDPNQQLEIVSFDHYPFNATDTTISRTYHYNHRIIRQKANGRPFWGLALTTRFASTFAPATTAKLRFSVLCPLAYGAKGIQYWTYERPDSACRPDWTGGLVSAGVTKPLYSVAKELNHYISNFAGPIIMSTDYVGTFHASTKSFLEENIPSASQLPGGDAGLTIVSLTPANTKKLMVGVFKDATYYYGFVVNQDTTSSVTNIQLQMSGMGIVQLGPAVVGYSGSTSWSNVTESYDWDNCQTTFTLGTLNAGEARMFRVQVGNCDIESETGDLQALIDRPLRLAAVSGSSATFEFATSATRHVSLRVFDVQGRLTSVVANGTFEPGTHKLQWDLRDRAGRRVSPGVYLYRAQVGNEQREGKVVLTQ